MKRVKNQKGQALVEFAIILPLLLLLIMGIIQFGMIINAYLSIQNAAREGARAGILGSSDTEIESIMINTLPALNADSLIVNITPSEADRSSGDPLTVNVRYNYPIIIPIIDSLFSNTVVLNAETSMRIE